jgi:hypothetical protein
MRGFSGAILRDERIVVGPVSLDERRGDGLRDLLVDLARPGLCLVLGAGASHGVIPMSIRAITELARELLEADGMVNRLPRRLQHQVEDHPECLFLTDLFRAAPRGAWDRIAADILTPALASYVLNSVFSPRGPVPPALTRIYSVLENERGVIVTYNYDRITDAARKRFRVISPHGERSLLGSDPGTRVTVQRIALDLHIPVKNDWWLPVPETTEVQRRPGYQEMLTAWRTASAIVFIGYGFGGGADAFSFEDFGLNASKAARIHALCPRPDNPDLCRQIGYALRGRGPRFRVFGHPYRWRALAEAMLEYLDSRRRSHIWHAIGAELEIAFRHDRK